MMYVSFCFFCWNFPKPRWFLGGLFVCACDSEVLRWRKAILHSARDSQHLQEYTGSSAEIRKYAGIEAHNWYLGRHRSDITSIAKLTKIPMESLKYISIRLWNWWQAAQIFERWYQVLLGQTHWSFVSELGRALRCPKARC